MDLSKHDVFAQCFEILQNAPDRICLSPVLNAQILAVDWSTDSVTIINSLERSWDSLIMNNLAMHEAKARFFCAFLRLVVASPSSSKNDNNEASGTMTVVPTNVSSSDAIDVARNTITTENSETESIARKRKRTFSSPTYIYTELPRTLEAILPTFFGKTTPICSTDTFVSFYKKYLPGDTVCRPPRIEEYYHPAYKSLAFAMWCLQASKGDIDYVLDFEADAKPYSFHHAKRPHHTALDESMAPKGYKIVAHEPTINLASILNPKAFATENNLTPAQAARFTNPIIAECRCKFIHRSKSWCKYKSTYIMYHPPTHLLVACRRPKIEVVKKKICKLNPVFHLGTKLEENASRLRNHEFNGSRIITSKIFPAWKSGSGAFNDKGESRELDIMAAYEIVPLADRNKHESANLV